MNPAFETRRLRVFEMRLEPMENDLTHRVFVAFLRNEAWAAVAATLVVWDRQQIPNMPGWARNCYAIYLEVATVQRRRGYGSELFIGAEEYLGCELLADGVTYEGEEFLKRLGRIEV